MTKDINLEKLKNELKELDEKRKRIIEQLAPYDSKGFRFTKCSRVINEAIGLIKKNNRSVSVIELREHLREIGIPIPPRCESGWISAVLTNETKRKYPRLRKNGYNLYNLSNQSNQIGNDSQG